MRIGWIAVAVVLVVGCKSKAEKEAYEAKRQALIAQLEAEKQAAEAKLAARRKACKITGDGGRLDADLGRECRAIVEREAKVQGSVEFVTESTEPFADADGCRSHYGIRFRSKNLFGVPVENYVKCTLDPRGEGNITWKYDHR